MSVDDDLRGAFTSFAVPTSEAHAVYPDLLRGTVNPYRGLDTFQKDDAPLFFGRERALTQLLDAFRQDFFIITLLGPSGSGKSSLVRAGLIPALASGALPRSTYWQSVLWSPDQLLQRYRRQPYPASAGPIELAVRHHLGVHQDLDRLVLIVDQFEEFLRPVEDELRYRILSDLSRIAGRDGRVTLLLVTRDDFYSRIASLSPQFIDGSTGLAVNLRSRLGDRGDPEDRGGSRRACRPGGGTRSRAPGRRRAGGARTFRRSGVVPAAAGGVPDRAVSALGPPGASLRRPRPGRRSDSSHDRLVRACLPLVGRR